MSKRISIGGLAFLIASAIVASTLYVVLNNAFGGPQIRLKAPYQITATFSDPQGLLKKSFVLARGVEVGGVEHIEVDGDAARVTFGIEKRYAPIYRNATIRTGNRTLLGEPYLELDPGTPEAGMLPNRSVLPKRQVLPNQEFDEALKALNKPAVDHLRNVAESFADGFRDPQITAQVNATWGAVAAVVQRLRGLTDTLRGQEPQISGLVTNSGTVLKELGDREGALRSIVADGNATLRVLAGGQQGLRATLSETPRLLAAGRRALRDAKPLLIEARPLVADLRAASPDLAPTLETLRPTARDAATVVEGLKPFNDAAVPALRVALPVVKGAVPVVDRLIPTLRNLIPTLDYVAPRARDIPALFSNLGEFANHGDDHGIWLRYNTFVAAGPSDGTKALQGITYEHNPYPGPMGNLDPRGFKGPYSRLMPYPLDTAKK
jgi:phospholipid/cholesterol/gamma-HCH transport system substrate-binding protein